MGKEAWRKVERRETRRGIRGWKREGLYVVLVFVGLGGEGEVGVCGLEVQVER
jgi:hypothetical protein